MKKLRIFLLTLLMVLTILPINTIAEGEDNSSKEPDVSVFATKDQLMTEFVTYSEGENIGKPINNNIGKIVFGKNSSGDPQEWYVLGKDSGVSGDNTVIFAASPIATGQVFEDDRDNNKTDSSLWSDCDYSGTSITEVYPNHYGASDLRVTLKAMATNTSYFTSAEQGMLNETTVATIDWNNGGKAYTTTDKLYALAADGYGAQYKTIKAGSNNQILLLTNDYWYIGNTFWLRSPLASYASGNKLIALSGYIREGFVGTPSVNIGHDIRPASNLNLTNVLFASAAKVNETGEIRGNAAMTLRLDGKEKGIGEAYYNTDTKEIIVTKGSPESIVYLVVQGKEGNQNWYYSKKIDIADDYSVEFVNSQDIKDALTSLNITDINLSNCKIWLETTDTDGMIYAVQSKEVDTITEIELNVEAPVAGKELDHLVYSDLIQWFNVKWDPEDENAAYNTEYTVSIILSPKVEYKFANSVTPKINGIELSPVAKSEDGTIKVEFTFPRTAADKIKAIEQPTITVPNGTDISTITLPDEVEVTGESGNKYLVIIYPWTPDPNNNYDPNSKAEQRLKYAASLNSTKIPNELYYPNPDVPDTILTIIVEAAKTEEVISTPAPITPVTDDGYVVPNTGVK